jgi:predicted deacetylase
MTRPAPWLDPVRSALEGTSHPVRVFFRDDDAGWDDDALFRLLDLCDEHEAPIDLAVIPCALTRPLAHRLRRAVEASRGRVALHQHGYAHLNHEHTGRKHEFGPSRSAAQQRADVAAGQHCLRELLDGYVQPIFTPPWNRCTQDTVAALTALGFRVLSRDDTAAPLTTTSLREVRVNVNWLTGRRGARVREEEQARTLAAVLTAPEPLGIMLHHAVMDASATRALADLLDVLAAHPRVRLSTMMEMARAAEHGPRTADLALPTMGPARTEPLPRARRDTQPPYADRASRDALRKEG